MLIHSPRAIWTKSVIENTELIHEYMANSMARVSLEMDRIRAAVKEAKVFVVLGYSERDRESEQGMAIMSPCREMSSCVASHSYASRF
jgi:hypothetical protein